MTEACDVEGGARARHLEPNRREEQSDENVCKNAKRLKRRDGEVEEAINVQDRW
jgi:hypothetical protein